MPTWQGLLLRVRRALSIKELPILDPRLANMERVFRAPELTSELIAAIRLISPHCDLKLGEKFRSVWEADQNGACWGEYEALAPVLAAIPKPRKVLEIGPGMGRSLVFFSKVLGWEKSEIHAYEGTGNTTKYTINGPRFQDSYCGSIPTLRSLLEFNGVGNVTIFDTKDKTLADMPGPYDLIYSFYCIGFHWALEHFFDDLHHLMHDKTIAIFTLAEEFVPFPAMEKFSYKVLDFKKAWPKDDRLPLLIISPSELPHLS